MKIFALFVLLFANVAQADDREWYEYHEHTITEESGKRHTIAFFLESQTGEYGDPDLGYDQTEKLSSSGLRVRMHASDTIYVMAVVAVLENQRGIDREGADDYILEVFANGCRTELDADFMVRHYCAPGMARTVYRRSPGRQRLDRRIPRTT